jgi:hypothetical protein
VWSDRRRVVGGGGATAGEIVDGRVVVEVAEVRVLDFRSYNDHVAGHPVDGGQRQGEKKVGKGEIEGGGG